MQLYELGKPHAAACTLSEGWACSTCAVATSPGSSTQFNALLQQAVAALSSYRGTLTSQLPAPVSSLTSLQGLTSLDTALAARAATYILQQLGSNKYQQVRERSAFPDYGLSMHAS